MKVKIFISLLIIGCTYINVFSQSISLQELVNKKKFAEVLRQAQNFTAADSADITKMLVLGQAYEGLMKNKDAYRCYKYCLSQDSTNMDILNSVGRMASSLGRGKEALSCFYKVLQVDSTDFYANFQMARLYTQQGEYDAAIYNYKYLLELDPENAVIWKNLGDCYMATPPPGIMYGVEAYMQAHSLNPENFPLAHLLVNILLPLGEDNVAVAIDVCDTTLYYHPNHKTLLRDKALAYYMLRKYNAADSIFTYLLTEKDSCYINLKYGGATRYKNKQFFDCVGLLERAWEEDTTSVEVNMLLGSALGKTYDRKRAFELFDKAEFYLRPPKDLQFQLIMSRAEILKRDGQPLEANREYYKAYKINPERTDILYTLAMLFFSSRADSYKDVNFKQRGLYNMWTYVKYYMNNRPVPDGLAYYRKYFQSFQEEMFFKGENRIAVVSPEDKKSYITIDELKELIDKMSAQEKQMREDKKKREEEIKKVMETKVMNNK